MNHLAGLTVYMVLGTLGGRLGSRGGLPEEQSLGPRLRRQPEQVHCCQIFYMVKGIEEINVILGRVKSPMMP